jgi:hypothetical protein
MKCYTCKEPLNEWDAHSATQSAPWRCEECYNKTPTAKKLARYAEFCENHTKEANDLLDAVDELMDAQTRTACYCGYLATGLHVRTCPKYKKEKAKLVLKSAEKAGLL